MTDPQFCFDTSWVRDLLANTGGQYERSMWIRPDGHGHDVDVSIRLVSNTEIAVSLTGFNTNANDIVTEKFYVKIFRGDVPDHETAKKLHL